MSETRWLWNPTSLFISYSLSLVGTLARKSIDIKQSLDDCHICLTYLVKRILITLGSSYRDIYKQMSNCFINSVSQNLSLRRHNVSAALSKQPCYSSLAEKDRRQPNPSAQNIQSMKVNKNNNI